MSPTRSSNQGNRYVFSESGMVDTASKSWSFVTTFGSAGGWVRLPSGENGKFV
jgi:hypothetical protein